MRARALQGGRDTQGRAGEEWGMAQAWHLRQPPRKLRRPRTQAELHHARRSLDPVSEWRVQRAAAAVVLHVGGAQAVVC